MVDVARFERLVADGRPAALEQVAGLYRGDLLAGLALAERPFEEWLTSERERLHELAIQGLGRLLIHQQRGGRRRGGRPDRPSPARAGPAAGARSPRGHAALRAARAPGGGVAPVPSLCGRAEAGAQHAAGGRDDPAHRRSSARPRPTAPPPPASRSRAGPESAKAAVRPPRGDRPEAPPPTNLPAPTSELIGRAAALAEVAELLAAHRLVTLTGAGGIGKTRLASRSRGELLPGFADGVWLVELAPLADPALVPGTVAAALGLTLAAGATVARAGGRGARARSSSCWCSTTAST